jgi:hypothetical protein
MKEMKVPSHQIDVVEIMKKIRQSASNNRSELTRDERVKREAKSEFQALVQSSQIPDYLAEQIRQQNLFEPYDPRTLYSSARSGIGAVIGLIRRILKPITKLFINLDPLAFEVHRLSQLNNLYLKTIQDLIVKTSTMQVEIYSYKKRSGHFRSREEFRNNNQGHQNRRRYGHGRRESNDNRSQSTRATSSAEPSAQ